MDSLCIVGAGVAGAGGAYAVRDEDLDVTVFEESDEVGGRAASRRREGCIYDYGANYLKTPDSRTGELVLELGAQGLREVDGEVWTFDAVGNVSEGDRQEHKWTWVEGTGDLARRLLVASDADVHTNARVESLHEDGDEWHVTVDGDQRGPFDAVMVTPPAPVTADLLSESDSTTLGDGLGTTGDTVRSIPYRSIHSFALHYPFELDRPWYALVDTSDDHAIGWVAREECKPDRVPEGESLLLVQMSPRWTRVRADEPRDAQVEEVARRTSRLVGDERLQDPDWTDDHRWPHALPDERADPDALVLGRDAGLYFAGDWVAGEGRLHRAMWNGIGTAEVVARDLTDDEDTDDDWQSGRFGAEFFPE